MENYVITVIIPIYNSSETLVKTIQSLNIQVDSSDCEVIIVDDGSVDNSYELYHSNFSNNKNIKYVKKTNGGPSSARNLGIIHSSGKYLTFLDSDDTVNRDFIQDYLECTKNNYDLIVMGYNLVSNNKNEYKKKTIIPRSENREQYTTAELFHILTSQGLEKQVWNKLYKKSIIENENVFFNEKIKIGEDFSFNLSYIAYAKTTYFLEKANYNHHINENSLSRSYKKYKFSHLKIVNEIYYQFLIDNGLEIKRAYLSRVNNVITCIADLSYTNDMSRSKKISIIKNFLDDEYLHEAFKILKSEKISLVAKTKIWVLKHLNRYVLYSLFKFTRFLKK